MKLKTTIGILALALGTSAQAAIFEYNFTGFDGVIPDAESTGWQNSQDISSGMMPTRFDTIEDVNVTLNISGGYNGDLYGYLVHDSGFAVLLNRVGRTDSDGLGYANTGFTVTLDHSAANDIHLYQNFSPIYNGQGQLQNPEGAAWQPDARAGDPATVTDGSSRSAYLTSFNNDLDPHGRWTLFFADNSLGEESTLMSWGLQITAVPEPVTWALMIFGGVVGGVQLVRRFAVRKSE